MTAVPLTQITFQTKINRTEKRWWKRINTFPIWSKKNHINWMNNLCALFSNDSFCVAVYFCLNKMKPNRLHRYSISFVQCQDVNSFIFSRKLKYLLLKIMEICSLKQTARAKEKQSKELKWRERERKIIEFPMLCSAYRMLNFLC